MRQKGKKIEHDVLETFNLEKEIEKEWKRVSYARRLYAIIDIKLYKCAIFY